MIPGAKPRAILTMLGLHNGSVVSAETLIELLWGDDPPRTAAKALQTHISSLRRTLGDGFVLTQGMGWTVAESEVDASRYKSAARLGARAPAAGDMSQAVARFQQALALWRGIPELPDGRRGTSEKTQWIEGHAALVEDRADALLATGRAAEIIGELEAAVAEAPLRERRWGQLIVALYRSGRQGDALGAYQRARAVLADELGVDPGPELRRLESAVLSQDPMLGVPGAGRGLADKSRSGNLPAARNALIGRRAELGHVASLLQDSRLVSVVGVGGAGKTRLAIEVARSLTGGYRDGAWLVELAPVASDASEVGVASAAAAALGVAPDAASGASRGMLERLTEFLSRRPAPPGPGQLRTCRRRCR